MTRAAPRFGSTLSDWLGVDASVSVAHDLGDVPRVRALLLGAAREQRSVSYSELLGALGHRFTRPRMRAVCKTLDAIDRSGAAVGEPELAVLVVREGDRLPGQGWWTGRDAPAWSGADARAYIDSLQQRAFDYWASID